MNEPIVIEGRLTSEQDADTGSFDFEIDHQPLHGILSVWACGALQMEDEYDFGRVRITIERLEE